MHRLRTSALTVMALATLLANACAPVQPVGAGVQAATQPPVIARAATTVPAPAAVANSGPVTVSTSAVPATTISLGDRVIVEGVGAEVAGSTVTITAGGTYTAGSQVTSFTVAGSATNAGAANAGPGRPGGPRR